PSGGSWNVDEDKARQGGGNVAVKLRIAAPNLHLIQPRVGDEVSPPLGGCFHSGGESCLISSYRTRESSRTPRHRLLPESSHGCPSGHRQKRPPSAHPFLFGP